MGYVHKKAPVICTDCIYRESILVSRRTTQPICTKYGKCCSDATEDCGYEVDLDQVVAQVEACEQYNLGFTPRYARTPALNGFESI